MHFLHQNCHLSYEIVRRAGIFNVANSPVAVRHLDSGAVHHLDSCCDLLPHPLTLLDTLGHSQIFLDTLRHSQTLSNTLKHSQILEILDGQIVSNGLRHSHTRTLLHTRRSRLTSDGQIVLNGYIWTLSDTLGQYLTLADLD